MKKGNFLKIFIILICLFVSVIFALLASGKNVPFIQTYTNNFKRNITGICNMVGISLPIEAQLYLDDMSTPTPKPTMMPKSYQDELEAALGITQQEEVVGKEGTTLLTAKETAKPKSSGELPVAIDSAGNSQFALFDNSILCVTETSYKGYSKKGEVLWETAIRMQNPTLLVQGGYVMISETGARKISLYKGKKHLFTAETEGNIISCDLSKNGDIVAVTEKEFYKGQVVVINNNGKTIFAWDSGSYNILDAAIAQNRRVAVSRLNTDQGVTSIKTCLDVNGNTIYKSENFTDNIVFDLSYIDNTLYAVSESRLMKITKKGEIDWEYGYSDKTLSSYKHASNGNTLLLFESSANGELIVVKGSGKAYEPIKTELMPTSIDITPNRIAYNNGRDVLISKYNGKFLISATCDSDIKKLYMTDKSHALCVYTSSIEVKSPKKVDKKETTAQGAN